MANGLMTVKVTSIYVLVSLNILYETDCLGTSDLNWLYPLTSISTPEYSTGTAKSTSTGALGNQDCPVSWKPLVSACYYFSEKRTNWSNANSTCRNLGGNLVIPRSNEKSALANLANQSSWIGLVRGEDKAFYTIYGSKLSDEQWINNQWAINNNKREPNNLGRNEDCVEFMLNKRPGVTLGWNDQACHDSRHFICEYRRLDVTLSYSNIVKTTPTSSYIVKVTPSQSNLVKFVPTSSSTVKTILSYSNNVETTPTSSNIVKPTSTFSDIVKTTPTTSYTGSCPSEYVGTKEALGMFMWPESKVGMNASISCPYNVSVSATRECQYTDNTFREISWADVDTKGCPYREERSENIFDLSQVLFSLK